MGKRAAVTAQAATSKKMRPAAAAKRDDIIPKQCNAVVAAMQKSGTCPEATCEMLKTMLPHCMALCREERHEFHAALVEGVEEELTTIVSMYKDGISKEEAANCEMLKEKESLEAELSSLKATLEEKVSVLQEKKYELARDAKVFQNAKAMVKSSAEQLEASGAEVAAAEGKLTELGQALASFQSLKEGPDPAGVDAKSLVSALIGRVRGIVALEEPLASTAPAVLVREPAARGPFDTTVVQQFEEILVKEEKKLQELIGSADKIKAERAAEVSAAQEAFKTTREQQLVSSEAYTSFKKEERDTEALILESKKSAGKIRPQILKGEKRLQEAQGTLDAFRQGALGVFAALRDRKLPTQAPATMELLARQDPATTAAIIDLFQGDAAFAAYAERMAESIVKRDNEDAEKLQKGIDMAVAKDVLTREVKVEPIKKVQVEGKTVDVVAGEIIEALGDAPSRGCVMTLQGASGTGKGETVKYMKGVIPNTQTWSNGNIFRSLTLLAVTYAEQNGCSLEDALKPDLLATFVRFLEFGEYGGKFDVKIEGLGLKHYVSDIQATELAAERVAKNIPTVAEVTQGEVINFVQGAFAKLCGAGTNVLVEGREQTLKYIRTPHRFELVLDDPNTIGLRRAAQVVAGNAWAQLKDQPGATEAAVKLALQDALGKL